VVSGPVGHRLGSFRVGGMVGIHGSGWIRLPRRIHTMTAAALTGSSGSPEHLGGAREEEVVPLVERTTEKRGPKDSVLGRRCRLAPSKA
jgi:hypothetical protein